VGTTRVEETGRARQKTRYNIRYTIENTRYTVEDTFSQVFSTEIFKRGVQVRINNGDYHVVFSKILPTR
jgi:hypothetical protein